MGSSFRWLRTGGEALAAMLAAIEGAQSSVRLETYSFEATGIGAKFREALVAARGRGLAVRVMIDAVGSFFLPADFWKPLIAAGGEFRFFNPLSLHRLSQRNHRKLLVVDERVSFIGGFNLADAYDGDGVTHGWRDLGLEITGGLTQALARTFDEIFSAVTPGPRRLRLLKRTKMRVEFAGENWRLLLSGPGRRGRRLRSILRRDIVRARSVKIICAYFIPPWRLRQALAAVCRRGGKVQLILAGKTDVKLSQFATRRLYRRLLHSGAEIYEYQPQILHAKLFIIDDCVCVGSANLDTRSLIINHELLVRIADKQLAEEARALFEQDLTHCRRIDARTWRGARTFWTRWLERAAYFMLVHVDPYIARLQLKLFRRKKSSPRVAARARKDNPI